MGPRPPIPPRAPNSPPCSGALCGVVADEPELPKPVDAAPYPELPEPPPPPPYPLLPPPP